MTYLEKYKQDHPDATYTCYGLPSDCDCPRDCGYETRTSLRECPFPGLSCEDCWNREMPEEKEPEKHCNSKVVYTTREPSENINKEPEKTRYIRIAVDEDTYSDIVNGAETTHLLIGPEDVVEAEPISQYADILNIAVHVNEIDVYDPDEIISNVFKQVSQIKDRMINISIM